MFYLQGGGRNKFWKKYETTIRGRGKTESSYAKDSLESE